MSPRAPTDVAVSGLPLSLPPFNKEQAEKNDGKKGITPLHSLDNDNSTDITEKHDSNASDRGESKLLHPNGSTDHDEYISLLEKRLDLIQTELRVFKSSKDDSNNDETKKKEDEEAKLLEKQKVEITRVPADQWRIVKTEAKINPKLSVLLVSSKVNFRTGPRHPKPKMQTVTRAPTIEDVTSPKFVAPNSLEPPYRLAINSTYLLSVLGQCVGTTFSAENNVLVRPFKYLVAYESEIREFLKEVNAACEQAESDLTNSTKSENTEKEVENEATTLNLVKDQASNSKNDKINTLETKVRLARRNRDELRCLIEFMDKDMQDIFDIRDEISNQTITEIAFEHLWQLYKPGGVVYSSSQLEHHSRCQAYRVLQVSGGRVCFDSGKKSSFNAVADRNWDSDSENDEKCRDSIKSAGTELTAFIIDSYSLDFDGYRVGPRAKRFIILPYNGKRPILSFPVHPAEFNPMYEEMHEFLLARGTRFTSLVLGAHKKYAGTTIREANQTMERGYVNFVIPNAEVKGEVMVDQAAGVEHFRKKLYKWQLKFGSGVISYPTITDKREVFDPLPEKEDQEWNTDVFDDSVFEEDRRSDFLRTTSQLQFRSIQDSTLPDDYLELLPPRVYGYAMLHRKWFPLDLNLVEDINENELEKIRASFEDLVLPEGHRMLLQALVKNQVQNPALTSDKLDNEMSDFSMDLVKGKGKGLIILLHGVPGVGKTSTAECVAAQLRRPLLPITCGDIGTRVREAEETLENFCELAYRWRCVLLLDEADVFLAKREKGDIKRNSLVSVFLRVLEYYAGVIILTTNRVGEFDEAFRSRIHISLYYPKLDRLSTKQIWERNITRIKNSGLDIDIEEAKIRKFYERHWQENIDNLSRRWNGRQIKNAFQTALALANWDFHESQDTPKLERPFLKASHFIRVAETSAHFDDYISDIHDLQEQDTYSVLAAREEVRKDTYQGISPKLRMRESRYGRSGPAGRAADYRIYDDYDDSDIEEKLESRARRAAAGRRSLDHRRAVDGEDYDDDDIEIRRKRGATSRRNATHNPGRRGREYDDEENAEDDDLICSQHKLL
ncbi:hypothetical protein F5884DRAFT_769723 [Xylogone sp. PMI_703]|nr:hypothetical protein F5884DRAFT_769723 [Xylogone sp. PMI_703]